MAVDHAALLQRPLSGVSVEPETPGQHPHFAVIGIEQQQIGSRQQQDDGLIDDRSGEGRRRFRDRMTDVAQRRRRTEQLRRRSIRQRRDTLRRTRRPIAEPSAERQRPFGRRERLHLRKRGRKSVRKGGCGMHQRIGRRERIGEGFRRTEPPVQRIGADARRMHDGPRRPVRRSVRRERIGGDRQIVRPDHASKKRLSVMRIMVPLPGSDSTTAILPL